MTLYQAKNPVAESCNSLHSEALQEAQIKALKSNDCEKVFAEQVSSVAKREQLEAALFSMCARVTCSSSLSLIA